MDHTTSIRAFARLKSFLPHFHTIVSALPLAQNSFRLVNTNGYNRGAATQ